MNVINNPERLGGNEVMFRERKFLFIIFISVIFAFVAKEALFTPLAIKAQYWALMPPYNVLWPLYAPALSPVDPVTGVPTPLVNELTVNTVLPVQPCIAWDPSQPWPWLLYNTPLDFGGGLLWYSWQYGLNPWPPSYLQDPLTGAPAPITWTVPGAWELLGEWAPEHAEWYLPTANATYALTYGLVGPPVLDLLTWAEIFGLPPILPY
ncbi:MAG: hypothetical protein ACMUJM_04765 [bacterium]